MKEKKYSLDFSKIETRSLNENGAPRYIVRGYAAVHNVPYVYNVVKDKNGNIVRALKEYFTRDALRNLLIKAKSRKIFVDSEHSLGRYFNVKDILTKIEKKTGKELEDEKNAILSLIKHSDIPLAKLTSLNIDDNGILVEAELNPFYRNIDENHKRYFDSVWNSLRAGYLDGLSLNFKPTKFKEENGIVKIDDVDVYGISFTGGRANHAAPITEVLMRSLSENYSEGDTMSEKEKATEKNVAKEELNQLKEVNKKLQEQLNELKSKIETQKENELKSEWEKTKEQLQAQIAELNKKIEERAEAEEKPQRKSVVQGQSEKFGADQEKSKELFKAKLNERFPEPSEDPQRLGSGFARYVYYHNPKTKMNGRLGEAIALQGEFRTHTLEDNAFLRKQKDDIVVRQVNKD